MYLKDHIQGDEHMYATYIKVARVLAWLMDRPPLFYMGAGKGCSYLARSWGLLKNKEWELMGGAYLWS